MIYLKDGGIIIIKENLNRILEILKVIEQNQQYDDDNNLIQDLIIKIYKMLNNNINITDDLLDKINKDLNYLDQKYFAQLIRLKNENVELNDIIRLFDLVQNFYKKRNHDIYVKKVREKNRKKREENGND